MRVAAALLLASGALSAPAAAQDEAVARRLEAMEARIKSLEAELVRLRAQPATPPAPAADAAATAQAPAPTERQVAVATDAVTGVAGQQPPRSAVVSNNEDDFAPNSLRMPLLQFAEYPIQTFGIIQYDFSDIGNPGGRIDTINLGYNGRARRLIFGFRGDLPASLRYNLEFNLAVNAIDYEDITMAFEPEGSAFSAKVGFFYPFVSLDSLTSVKRLSVVERAQMNEAWQLQRRIGAAFGLVNKSGDLRFTAGIFNGQINASSANTEWQLAARGVWSPTLGDVQLHLGANYQYRRTPTQNQSFLYQARPFTQSTNIRFVGTGPATANGAIAQGIATSGDQIMGYEFGGIFGSLHVASEGQYVLVDGIKPGDTFGPRRGTTGLRLASDPEFYSVYGELGWFLTGETRGYRNGRFFRTKVLRPVDEGGIGAFQIVGRVDHLDLSSRVGGSGPGVIDGILNGGKQTGYLFALHYWPLESLRFTAQYSRIQVTGGPSAGQADPLSARPLTDRDFGLNAFVTRAQIEF